MDFFSENSGSRSGEQLFNMIDMCTVFSLNRDIRRSVLCSLFNISPENMGAFNTALDAVKKAAVGFQTSKSSKELGLRDLRNRLFHDFLTIDALDFDALVACAVQLLEGCRYCVGCINDYHLADYPEHALAEIQGENGIVNRDMQIAALSNRDHEVLVSQRLQMLEELERFHEEKKVMKEKFGRKFDCFAVCLKKDISEQLIPSKLSTFH
jgi:hypothetical protein